MKNLLLNLLGLLAAFILVGVLSYTAGESAHPVKPASNPTTFTTTCSGGVKVFTTPQGGIAVFPESTCR